MIKEKIKLIDGTEQEIDLPLLSGRKAALLQKKYVPLNQVKQVDGGVQLGEGVDIAGMAIEILDGIEGLDTDKVIASDCGRIFHKYYFKEIMAILGVGDPN